MYGHPTVDCRGCGKAVIGFAYVCPRCGEGYCKDCVDSLPQCRCGALVCPEHKGERVSCKTCNIT